LFNKAEHPVEGAKTPTWWERLFNKAEPSVEEAKTPTWWERLFNKAEPSVEEAQTPTWWKRLFNRAEPPVEGDKTPTWWKRLFNKAATPTGRSATEVSALATNIPNRPVKQAKDLYDNSFIRAVRGLTGFGSNVVIGAGDVLSTGVDAARLVAGRPLDAVRLRASGLLARGAAFKGQGLMGGTLNKVGSILSDIGIKDVSLTTAAYAFDIINTVSSFNRLKAINKNSSLEDITADVVTYRRSSSSLLWNLTIDVTTQSYGSLASLFSIPLSKRYANTTDARKKATELYSKVQRGEEIDTFDLIESEHYIAGGTLIFVSGASLLERYYHKKLDVGYVNIRANQTKLEDLKVDNAKINLKTIEHKISDEYAKATPDKNEILRLEAEARSINEKLKVRPVEININEKHRAGIATRKREITSTTKAIETRRQRSIKYTSTTLDGLTGFAKFKAQVKNAWVGVGNSIRERHIQADINKLGQLQSEIIHLEQSNQPRTINVTGYFDANELEYSDQLFIKYRLGRLTRWAKQTFDSWLAKRKKAKPNNGLQTERFTIKEKFRALHQQATNIYNSRPGTGLDLIHSISIAEGRYTAGVDSIETAEDFLRNTQNSITERTTFFSVVNQLESEVATLSKYLPGPSYLPPALINIDSAFTEGANPPSINYMKANAANLSKTNQILAFTTDVTNKYGGSAFDSSDFVNEVKALQNETLNRLNNNKRVTGNLIKTFKQLEGFYKELTPSLQTAQEARSSIQAMELTPQEVKTELKGLDRITNLLFGRFDKQTKDYTSTDNKPVTLASFGNSIRTRLSNLSARFTSVSTSTTPTTPTIQTPITTPAPNDSALITSSSALNREQQELSTLVNQITEDSKGLFTTAVDEQGFFSFSGDERRSVQTVRGANPFALKIRSSIIKTFKAVIAPSKLSAYDRLQTQYGSTPFSGGVSGLGFGLFGSYLAATALRPVGYNLGLDISKGNEDVAEGIASLAQFTGGLAGGIGASAVGRQVMIRALDSSGAIRSIAKADYFASRSMSRNWSAVSNKVSAKLIAGGAGRLVQSTADMGLDYAIAAGIGVSGAVKVATADTEEERLSGFKRIGAASGAITVGTAFAVAGSFIPIPGATFVTGAIGSAVGDWLGSRLGEAIYYLTKPFRNELPTTTNIYTTNQLYKTDMALRRKDNIALDYIVKPVIKASRWVSKKLGYKDKYTTNYGPVIPVQSQTISPLAPIPQPVPHTNKVIPPTGGPLIPQGYMPHPVQIAFKKPDRRINSYVVNEQEKNLLYKLIYEEAKGESPLGRLAVANSILLRFSLIKSGTVTPGSYNIRKPASQVTITDVIKAKDQYQPYRTGKLNNTNMPTGDYNQIEGLVEGLLTKGNVQSFMDMGLTQEKAKHLAAMPNFRVKSDPTEATYYQRSRGLTIGNHRFAPDWLNGGGRPLSIFSSYYKTSANVPSTNVSTVDTTPKQPSIAITPSSQQRTGGTNYRERYKNAKFNPTVMAIIEHTFEGPHQKLLMQNVNRIDIRKDEKLSYGEAYFYYYPDTKKGGVYLDPKAYRELSSINTLTPETAETLSHELRHIQQYLQPALTGQPFVFITDINKIPKNKRSSILDLVNLSVSGTEDIINSRTISGLAPFDKSLQTKKELDAYIFTTIRTGDRERLLANLKQEYSIQGTNTDISKRTQVTPPPAVVTPAKTTLPPKGNRLNPTLSVIFSEVFDDKIEDSLMQYLPTIAVDKNLSPGSATYYEDSNTIKLDPQTFKAVQSIDTIKPEHISLLTHEAVHVQQNLSRKLKLKYTPDLDLSKLTKDQEAFVMNSAMTSTIEILSVGGTKNSQQALVDETEAYLFGFKHDSRIIANVYKSQGRKPIERRLGVSDLGLPPMPEIPGYTPATTPTAITSTIPPTTPTTPPIVPSKQPKRKETGIIVQTSPVYQLHLQDGEVFSVGDFTADTNTGEYTNGSSLYNKRDTDPIGYIVRPDERIMNNPRVTDLIQTQTRVSQSLNTSAQIISHDRALVTNAKFRSTYDSAQQAFTRYQTTGNFDDLKRAVELAGAARSIYDTPEVQSLLVQINGALTVKLSSTIDSLRPTYPNVTTTPIYKQGTQPTVTQPQTVSPIPQNNIVPLLPLGVDQQDNTGSIFNKPPEITTTPTVVTKPPTEVHKYIIPNERFGKAYLSTYGARKTTLQDLGFVGWSGDLPKDIAESNRLWVAGSKTLSPAELHHLAKERLQLGKQFFANKPNTKTFLDALQKDVDVTGAIYNAVKADTIIQTATTKEQLLQAKTLYQSSNVTFFKYNNQWNKYFNVQITSISNTIEYNTQAVQLAQQQQVQQQQQQQRNTLITNKLDTARINSRLHGNQTRITRPLDPNKDGFSIKFSNSLIQQMYNKHIYSKDVNLAVSPLAVERKLAQQKLDALIAYAIQNGLPESDINKLVQLNNTIDRSLPANYNQATALKIRQRVITLNTEIQRLSTLKQGDQASTAAPLYSKVVQQYNSLRAIDPNGQYFNIPTSFTTAYNMSVAGLRKTTPLINFDSYLQNSETGRRILHLEGTVVGPYKQRVDNAIDPNAGLTINQAFKKEGVGYSRLSASLTEAQNQWLSLKGQKSNRDQSGRPIISNEFIDDKIAQIETLKGANQFNALAKVNESLDYARDLLKDKDNYNQVGSIIRNVINPITGYAVQARGLSNVYDEKANELAKSSYQLGFETAITTARAYHTLGDERMAAYLASRKKNIKESQLHISVTPTKGNDGPRFSLGYIGAFTAYDEIQSYYLNALSLYNIRLTSPDGKASLQAYQIGVNQRLQTDNRNELNRRVNSTNGSIRKERDRLYTNLTNVQNSLKGQLASLTRAVETHDSKLLQSNLKTTFGNTNVANVFTALKAIKAGQSATLVLDINSPVGQLFALDPERGFTYLTNYLNVYAATGNPDWQATTTNKLIKTQLDRSYGILSKFIGSSLVKNQDGSLRPVTALPVPWSIDRDAVIDYTPGQRISQEVYKRIKNKVAGQDLWEVTYSNTLSTTGYSFLDGLRGDQRSGDSAKEARRRDRLAAAAGTPVSILAFMTSRALDNKTNVLDDRFAVPLGDGHYELVKVGDVFERLVDGNKADRWLQYHYMTAVRTNQVFVPGQSIPSKVTVGLYNSYNYQEEAYQFLSYSTAKFQNAVGPNVFGLKLGKTLDSLGRVFNTVSGVLGAFAPVVGVSYAQTNNKQNQGVPINVMQYVTDLNRGTITSFFNNPNNPHLLPLVNKLGFLFKNDGHTAQVDPTLLTASGVGKVNNPINSLKPGTVISNRTLRFDNTFISLTTYFDPFTYDVIGAGGLTSGKPLSRQQQLTAIRGAATINLLYAISNLDAYTVATRQVTGNLALNTLRSFLGLPGATIDMGIGLAVTGLQLILTKASQNPQDLARAIKKIKEIQNQGGITINGVSAPDGKAPHNLNNNFGGGFNRKVPQNDFTDFGDDIRLFNEQDLKVPDSKRKANEKDVSYNKVNETDQQDVFNEKVKATTKEVEQALKVAKEAYSTQYKVEIPFDKNPDFAHVIGNAVAKAEQKYATSDNVPEIKIANGKVQIDVYNEDKYVNEMFAVANGYANNPLAHVI
jgi:hypothetical protein